MPSAGIIALPNRLSTRHRQAPFTNSATAHGVCLLQGKLSKLFCCLAVAGAFGEHLTPKPLGFADIASFLGEGRQVSPGEMPVYPLVHAGELLRPRQGQDPPPAVLCLRRLAAMAVHDGLAEPQLRIFGVERKPLGAGPQSADCGSRQHLVGAGNQGIELTDDRIRRRRMRQAAVEVRKCVVPFRAFDGNRAEIEQGKRIVRPFSQLFEQDSRVAIELSGPQFPVSIPGMANGDITPLHRYAGPFKGRKDLLVNPVRPPDAFDHREQPDMIDDGISALAVRPCIASAAHDEGAVFPAAAQAPE